MTARSFFILVPALIPSGPAKGAVALANGIAAFRPVTLVTLKPGYGPASAIDPRVRVVSLAQEGAWRKRLFAYRAMLREAGGRAHVASISSCFSGDAINLFCRREAVTCSSVRGNLPANYGMDHGLKGRLAAYLHLFALRGFDVVLAMSRAMADQLRPFTHRPPEIVGNFVNEGPLAPYRSCARKEGPFRFLFLASLSPRKQPLLLLRAMKAVLEKGVAARLDIVGKGPLREACHAQARALGLETAVTLQGQLDNPYTLLAMADAMVLPSLSEGISRAALEALALGVPCVLRDVDGNGELIEDGVNGRLFSRDEDLPQAMVRAAEESRARTGGASLLPPGFRQEACARRTIDLMETL